MRLHRLDRWYFVTYGSRHCLVRMWQMLASSGACGNRDGLIRISQGVHRYLKEKDIPHVCHIDTNAHDATEWANNLDLFAQRTFK